jgi:hypothetical protein
MEKTTLLWYRDLNDGANSTSWRVHNAGMDPRA